MKKAGIIASVFGMVVNFALFLSKLYVAIGSNSLSIYCDSINNLFDVFSCAVVFCGFLLAARLEERPAMRTQSLFTFVVSTIVAVTGAYFIYNGVQRVMYPVQISYSYRYAAVILITVLVKIIMAVVYYFLNKKAKSKMLSALVLDCVLDCGITVFTLLGFFVVKKAGFAVDGIFAVALGLIITVSAVKNIVAEAKYIIND
ncbi:MAG: cation transporter [Eubacterium sp.]|nr:cation transporter [Eubacterium sp.]